MRFDIQSVLKKVKDFSYEKINPLFENRISLGITGLSHSGKTTFITSLINLLEQDPDARVEFSGENNTFPYAEYKKRILEQKEWPFSTTKTSEIHLKINRKEKELFLDIIDYPGEWLLDLPLIQKNYNQWSQTIKEYVLKIGEQKSIFSDCLLGNEEKNVRKTIEQGTQEYVNWLKKMQEKGYSFLQPGHFLLPEEAGDVYFSVNFFPWIFEEPETDFEKEIYGTLEQKYNEYKENIVVPFYQNFKTVQKQIILVDTFGSLSRGDYAWNDLKYTISQLLDNFSYTKMARILNWVNSKLFHHFQIEKVMFCSTKLDRLSDTQDAVSSSNGFLKALMMDILRNKKDFAFETTEIEYHSVCLIKACDFKYSSEDWSYYTPNGIDAVPIPKFLAEMDLNSFSQKCSSCKSNSLKPIVKNGKFQYKNMAFVLKFIFGDK